MSRDRRTMDEVLRDADARGAAYDAAYAGTAQGQIDELRNEARGFTALVARALLAAPGVGRALRWLVT